jgi:hypothetical protein
VGYSEIITRIVQRHLTEREIIEGEHIQTSGSPDKHAIETGPRRIKVLLVSFYNDEAYGLRSLHSALVQNKVDARMLFFKVESKQFREDHEENIKKDFIGSIKNASDREIELLADCIESNGFDVVGFSLVSSHFSLYKRIYQKIRNIKGITVVLGGVATFVEPG